MKNAHTTTVKAPGVQALVEMIHVQKYALPALNLVAADASDGAALASQHYRISEAKQFMLHGAGGCHGILAGQHGCATHCINNRKSAIANLMQKLRKMMQKHF